MTKQKEVKADMDEGIGLADIISFFRQSWKLIMVFGVCGLALTATYVLVVPAQYEATFQIKMATYGNSSNIESPAELINRLKFSTTYSSSVLRECGVAEGEDGHFMEERVKASVVRGVPETIEIKLRSNKPEGAKSCANALVSMISFQQQEMLVEMQKQKQEQLDRIKEELADEEKQFNRAKQGGDGLFAGLVTLVNLTSLRAGMDRLKNEIMSTKSNPTKLVFPVSAPQYPVYPKVSMMVSLGAFVGLLFGVIFAALRNQYRRLSEQK